MRMEVVRPRKAQAPTGSGLRTRPAMVERKMERSCHAWAVTSGGFGTAKRTRRPIERERIKGTSLAPCGAGSGTELSFLEEEGGNGEVGGFGRGLKRKDLRDLLRRGKRGDDRRREWEEEMRRRGGVGLEEEMDLERESWGRDRRWCKEILEDGEKMVGEWSAKLSIADGEREREI